MRMWKIAEICENMRTAFSPHPTFGGQAVKKKCCYGRQKKIQIPCAKDPRQEQTKNPGQLELSNANGKLLQPQDRNRMGSPSSWVVRESGNDGEEAQSRGDEFKDAPR